MQQKFYMIDLDGTMYHGSKIIPGAKKFIDYLIKHQIPFLFLTNNATRTQEECAQHMLKMGFKNILPAMFFTSGMAAASYIQKQFPNQKKAGYIGEPAMKEILLDYGFEIEVDNPDFLFVGLDRFASYQDYCFGLKALLNGAKLVGTNNDRIIPTSSGANVGNGAIVAMFEYAANVQSIHIGKPFSVIFEEALKYANVLKENVVMIGDNLETDILLGKNAGVDTILVTTGVHDMSDCFKLKIQPTYIVDDLSRLVE